MKFEEKLDKILIKHQELAAKLLKNLSAENFVKISKEYSDLEPIVQKIENLHAAKKLKEDLKTSIDQLAINSSISSDDKTMKEMYEQELRDIEHSFPKLEHEVKISLLPQDDADKKNAILEVRAGTGGEEAGLFASSLFRMYQRYSELKKWKFEVLDYVDTGIGGCKEATAVISGNDVFSKLKFESGVHRVQRIPDTESNGRIHTSAATVAVLPEAEEVDVKIEEKDLKIDTYRSSGAGGQHVNTTDSAVRITHLPSGIVVTQQDQRSQQKNKAKAMKVLMSKLYDLERNKIDSVRSASRKGQVGSGDRSERIRTYNFPQGRMTDHRINFTSYNLVELINEGKIDDVVNALIAEDEANRIAEDLA